MRMPKHNQPSLLLEAETPNNSSQISRRLRRRIGATFLAGTALVTYGLAGNEDARLAELTEDYNRQIYDNASSQKGGEINNQLYEVWRLAERDVSQIPFNEVVSKLDDQLRDRVWGEDGHQPLLQLIGVVANLPTKGMSLEVQNPLVDDGKIIFPDPRGGEDSMGLPLFVSVSEGDVQLLKPIGYEPSDGARRWRAAGVGSAGIEGGEIVAQGVSDDEHLAKNIAVKQKN